MKKSVAVFYNNTWIISNFDFKSRGSSGLLTTFAEIPEVKCQALEYSKKHSQALSGLQYHSHCMPYQPYPSTSVTDTDPRPPDDDSDDPDPGTAVNDTVHIHNLPVEMSSPTPSQSGHIVGLDIFVLSQGCF